MQDTHGRSETKICIYFHQTLYYDLNIFLFLFFSRLGRSKKFRHRVFTSEFQSICSCQPNATFYSASSARYRIVGPDAHIWYFLFAVLFFQNVNTASGCSNKQHQHINSNAFFLILIFSAEKSLAQKKERKNKSGTENSECFHVFTYFAFTSKARKLASIKFERLTHLNLWRVQFAFNCNT